MSVADRRAGLLRELVTSVTGAPPGGPAFEATLKACATALEHHSFLDTRPQLVDESYALLRERLDDHAQFDKAQALELLRARLLALPLPSSQPDAHHRLLCLLHAAARRVLETRLHPSALLVALAQEAACPTPNPLFSPAPSSDGDSWDADAVAYSPGDHLSEWSDDDDRSQSDDGTATPPEAADSAAAGEGDPAAGAGAAPGTPTASPRKVHRSPRRLARRLAPPPPARRRASPYGPTSLAVWLAAAESGGHPARLLDPRLCFTDAELVTQSLNVLKGIAAPGPAYSYNAASGEYSVRPGVHLHTTAPAAAASLLRRAALLGSRLRALQTFSDGLVRAGAGGVDAQLRTVPTAAAFAAALRMQLHAMRGQLLCLELDARAGGVTLLTLRLRTSVLEQQAAALHSVVQECSWAGSGAATAARLLGALHRSLQRHMLQATSQGGVVAGMILAVFVAACKPCLEALHAWMERGEVPEWAEAEFFIAAMPLPRGGDQCALQRCEDGSSAAPPFLAEVAEEVLAAGTCVKALQQRNEGRSAGGSDEPAPSLYTAFVASLAAALQRHQADIRGADKPRLASPLRRAPPQSRGLDDCSAAVDDAQASNNIDLEDWLAATDGSAAPLGMQLSEDLPPLLRLPPTAWGLPTATMCTPRTAVDDVAAGSDGAAVAGEHAVAGAMRRAAERRVAQAAEGGAVGLDPGAPHPCEQPAPDGDVEVCPVEPSAPAPCFEGGEGWGEWFAHVATQLASADGLASTQVQPIAAAAALPSSPCSPGGLLSGGPALCNNAPPLDVLLEDTLLEPVRSAARRSQARLCQAALSAGLLEQLGGLRQLHLLAAPGLEDFISPLLARISTARGVDALSQFELNASLQDALAAEPGGHLPGIAAVAVELAPAAGPAAAALQGRLQALSRLSVCVQPAWALGLLCDEPFVRCHAALLQLLLQLRWVRESLHAARHSAWKSWRLHGRGAGAAAPQSSFRQHYALEQEMLHLCSFASQHIASHFAAAGRELDAVVQRSATLSEARRACERFVAGVERGCLLGGVGLPKLLRHALLRALEPALQHCALRRHARRLADAMAAAGEAGEGAEDGASGLEPPAQAAAELQQRLHQVEASLAAVGGEFVERQRLFLRLVLARTAEAGAHGQELRELLAALDLNGHFAAQQGEASAA